MRLKADLTLLLVAILWGSAFAAQRIAGQLGSVLSRSRRILAYRAQEVLVVGMERH